MNTKPEKEENTYHCPGCEHTENKPFSPCPKCGTVITWE